MHPHLQDRRYFINLSRDLSRSLITWDTWNDRLVYPPSWSYVYISERWKEGKKTITCLGAQVGGYFLRVNLHATVSCPLCLHHAPWPSCHHQTDGCSVYANAFYPFPSFTKKSRAPHNTLLYSISLFDTRGGKCHGGVTDAHTRLKNLTYLSNYKRREWNVSASRTKPASRWNATAIYN